MTEIRLLTEADQQALTIPNEAFPLMGRLVVTRTAEAWGYHEELLPREAWEEQTFPDEDYQIATVLQKGFAVGAFEGETCVGLALFEMDWLKYVYLADLKVNRQARGKGIAAALLEVGRKEAVNRGKAGIWTIGQDNNLGACRFYLKQGFVIGGLNTNVYRHTQQEGKGDVYFYWE